MVYRSGTGLPRLSWKKGHEIPSLLGFWNNKLHFKCYNKFVNMLIFVVGFCVVVCTSDMLSMAAAAVHDG